MEKHVWLFFEAQTMLGLEPEVVCKAGRWKTLAFKLYIQAFDLAAS